MPALKTLHLQNPRTRSPLRLSLSLALAPIRPMASSFSLSLSAKPSPFSRQTLARPRSLIGSSRCGLASGVGNGVLAIKRARESVVMGSAVTGVDGVRVTAVDRKEERPVIVIDNYDSFTYNLCQYMGELGTSFEVYRNDEITVEEMRKKNPRGILISPGPGAPKDSGISLQSVLELGPSIPLFGVCMGLQCIGEAFGGKIVRSPSGVVHGKSALVYYDEKLDDTVFNGLPNPFTAARYHSLVLENNSFPGDVLEITAWTEDGLIMAVRHKKYRHIQGVQFHPESVITMEGLPMVRNFIKQIERFEVAESGN